MSPSKWLVLGLGNPLAGADGFGPAVIETVRAGGGLPEGVELADVHTDLLGHLDRFAGADHVILVDAMLASTSTGVSMFGEETFSTWEPRSAGVHGFSALMAVQLYRRLQRPGAPCSFDHPRITLVANLVREADFSRPPDPGDVEAGAEAVRSALTAGTPWGVERARRRTEGGSHRDRAARTGERRARRRRARRQHPSAP